MLVTMSKNSMFQDNTTFNYLMEGVSNEEWGYGIRRITIKANTNAPEFVKCIPYTFTSAGFKSQEGNWFVCLRMNVDQYSPQKMRPMSQTAQFQQLWGAMMLEFAQEYADKHKYNQLVY